MNVDPTSTPGSLRETVDEHLSQPAPVTPVEPPKRAVLVEMSGTETKITSGPGMYHIAIDWDAFGNNKEADEALVAQVATSDLGTEDKARVVAMFEQVWG